MDNYVTGAAIKSLREAKGITQSELAERIGVTGKAVSKWETAKGLPDISLLEPLSLALGVSVMELMQGAPVKNQNKASNIRRAKFCVCPVCGNILFCMGEAAISCCGIALPPLEAEPIDDDHSITIEKVEDEQFITVHHPMSKDHFISFIALVTYERILLVKLYPEGNAQTRLPLARGAQLFLYCNRHGLMKKML